MAFFGRQLRFSLGQDSGNKIPIAKDPPIPELKISPSRSHPGLASSHETAYKSATGQLPSLPLIDAISDKRLIFFPGDRF